MNTDTIAALSTPEGKGALAVIRVSGKDSISILGKVFRPAKKKQSIQFESWRAYYGYIYSLKDSHQGEEVVVTVFREPQSYTRENMFEISCHGGKIAAKKILRILFNNGAKPAKRGEFTKRALLNGRIDLIKAEAIDKIIDAHTEQEYEIAVRVSGQEHENAVLKIKNNLMEILEEVEVSIEDPDDYEIEETVILGKLNLIGDELDRIVAASENKDKSAEVKLVLFGRKNAGKSTLFNKLLEKDRSIITEIPGTTRDVIEAGLIRNGEKFLIVDTAGYGGKFDRIDEIALKKAMHGLEDADIIVFMVDGTKKWTEEETIWIRKLPQDKKIVIAWNKKDLKGFQVSPVRGRDVCPDSELKICSLESKDLEFFWKEIDRIRKDMTKQYPENQRQEIFLISQRQVGIIKDVKKKLESIEGMIEDQRFTELIAFELHHVRKLLNDWLGIGTAPEILDQIFSRFCVGK